MRFIDLQRQYQVIKETIQKRINTVIENTSFIMGPEVQELEDILSKYCGVKHCITCSSGTDALLLPLIAKGIGPGDAVLTTPFTFFATAEVISLLGATPVFVDICRDTFNIDPLKAERTIIDFKAGRFPTPQYKPGLKLRAIIAVDLFGLPADYDAINAIARKYGLLVIEDAAQSFGGKYHGRMACNLAEVAATSFFPAKPLGCYGDGGAVFTNDGELADVMRSLRIHGKGKDQYDNVRIGINGRLDTLQAAVLLSKMEIFEDEILKRQWVAEEYTKRLYNVVKTPTIPCEYRSAWAQYTLISNDRANALERLKKAGIPTMVYYPKPLHLQTAFAALGYRPGSMPVAEELAGKVFSLPMHPYLTGEEIDRVCAPLLG